jgi:hypothetical protein
MVRKVGSGPTLEEHLNSVTPESVKMFEQELVDALKVNGFAETRTRTLEDVYVQTMQDFGGGYSLAAFYNCKILQKYLDKYGKLTVENILNPK